jgi:cytochrome P450
VTAVETSQSWGILPGFVRATLGVRSPRRFPFDSMVRVRVGEQVFLLTHPDDVRHVLVTNARNYTKTRRLVGEHGRRRAGMGILTATGAEHLRQRRLLQPRFSRDAVAAFDATIREETGRMLDRWSRAHRVDLGAEMTDLAKSIIITALLGPDLDDATRGELARAIAARRRFTELVHHGRLPWRDRLPTPTVRQHRQALEVIDAAIYSTIARRREDARGHDDVVTRLLAAAYPDGSRMPDRLVRDEVLAFTGTGYETLAEALTWALYLLARHEDVAADLVEELTGALDGRAPGADDLPRLRLTGMVLDETLRLYPPTWLYARIPLEDDVLPVGGPVRAGAMLYVCQWVMHRHPRYFPDPDRFDPHRFAPGARPPRYVYLPFGDGLHRCLGEHLARLESILVIAGVTGRVRLELLDERPVEPRAGLTLGPRGPVWAHPHPRIAVGGDER